MNHTYFITGYPGFLASSLIKQLIDDHHTDIERVYLLILPSLQDQATEEITRFSKKHKLDPELFSLVTGDITQPNLGLQHDTNLEIQQSATHVFHLAAIYDLAVPKDIAFNVNVYGTHQVNNWVKALSRLERYIYFSTAYVSGTREGRIYEHELAEEQTFKNHYEQTKFEAELLVDDVKDEIPTTIIRPGIVKGNSVNGQTTKFDGIYFMLNFLDNLCFLPVIPYLGEGEPEGNFVPADYVLRATSYLAINPIGVGKTYHLTDPKPYQMRELQKILTESYLGKTPVGRIPISATKFSLLLTPIRKWLQVEKEAMDYFTIHSSYDCSQATADLEDSGVVCPDLKDTVESMINFYRKYKHDNKKHITIT
ncbi:SDR family oxidoreductase [Virgibacillus ndiopensis]|uniref:SDR family oxidoreductase n=1 Tax=Virgibacillus ndiopensis TaxID=2004408 RepID=UPI000C07DC78|nr:SDR family oxidoreductase [Virgibacillus ndiopensis]